MLCGGLFLAAVFHLPFPDHVHEFNAGEKNAGAAKVLEAEHRSGSTFNGTVVLLDEVVQVLDLAHDDLLPSPSVHSFESCHIRATFIDRHFLRCAVPLDRLFEEPSRRGLVAMRPQQEIDSVTCLVDGTVQILPLALDLDVGLVHPPASAGLAPGAPERLLEDGQQLDRSAVHGRVIG